MCCISWVEDDHNLKTTSGKLQALAYPGVSWRPATGEDGLCPAVPHEFGRHVHEHVREHHLEHPTKADHQLVQEL